jgi:glycyl-tRNA synthetase
VLCDYLAELTEEEKQTLSKVHSEAEEEFEVKVSEDKTITVSKDAIEFDQETKMVVEEKFAPSVIEPSFGIGRLVYCVLEHCFRQRPEDAQRTYFDFPALVAPVKTSILPLISNNEELLDHVHDLKKRLNKEGVTSKIDDSGQSIGRRYARTDECGIPFAITVDFDTLKDNSATLRELHSMKQVRLPIDDLSQVILNLATGVLCYVD